MSKSFRSQWTFRRTPVVRDLSLRVEPGEIFGFLGPNGAGKTTTIKMMMGLIHVDAGEIRILGGSHRSPTVRRRLGFLPENPYFYDYLTGRELLAFYARFFRMSPRDRRRKVDELLERTGVAEAADRPLRKYSKGMLQRLGLAQALLGDPELVVLDEPMSGLDPVGRHEVRDIILDLRRQGCTVFFSSHILQDAEMLCDRVGILVRGRLRSHGKLSELIGSRVRAWEVTVADGGDALPGTVLSSRQGAVLRRVESEEELRTLLDAVARSGARLISLIPQREGLEDVFLRDVDPEEAAAEAGRGR
ncbi:MAG: ABC transporter ATP-binding protein [Acidobacteriota bacterium]